jgi:site-specific recombinase XerD
MNPAPQVETHTLTLDVPWLVAPGAEAALSEWIRCRDRWLLAKQRRSGSQHTLAAYQADFYRFFSCFRTEGLAPWSVTRSHAEQWIGEMVRAGLAPASIRRRISAMASFYDYAAHRYTLIEPGLGEIALWDRPNPFRQHDLPRITSEPHYPTAAEFTALLRQINLDTVCGLRNLALIAGLFATTRRVSEWVGLQWGAIREDATGRWFSYRLKGGGQDAQALADHIYRAIVIYLQAANRWPLQSEDFIFVAHSDSARRFTNVDGTAGANPGCTEQRPLSPGYVWRLIRRYGAAAGIQDRKLYPHSLRHAGARYRVDLGADPWEMQRLLGHRNIATTNRYTHTTLVRPQDRFVETIGDLLPRQAQYRLRTE